MSIFRYVGVPPPIEAYLSKGMSEEKERDIRKFHEKLCQEGKQFHFQSELANYCIGKELL